MNLKLAATRPWFVFLAALLLATGLVCGCDRPEPASPPVPPPEPDLAQQLALGRSLQSSGDAASGKAGSGKVGIVELRETAVDDAMLQQFREDDDWVKTLILDAGQVHDEGAAAIARLPNLRHLRLRHSPLTDQALQELAGQSTLQILNLPQSDATAAGVGALARLPALRSLRLGGERLGPETAEAVASIATLRSVHLIGVPINDAGLKKIAALPKLRSLYVDDSRVTSDGWDWFFEHHRQVHVHVNQKHLDRDQEHP
ncbi:hypothetical protein FYK55_24690 [Roseiconus nitratireducens]|uniref:Leucine Rich repeats (2 copies) n=1 Tax=Roseiconus nitratireducens TaxID=2605748 RepID=A0A5M6CVM5_9BACT|nr:hypothetical protein [Roseiconus nitratireducens]KAA5539308.1 hypothetical protein FYK55_24690 [Roseiconus nitratireducens]